MFIDFSKTNHTYAINGEIVGISVTELLKKHGLAPSFSGVSEEVLAKAAERGKEIHADCEGILNEREYTPATPQGIQFAKWAKENLSSGVAELPLGIDYRDTLIAGTADVMGTLKDGRYVVCDHKTTHVVNKEYVTWQVNLLDYMARKLYEKGETLNGRPFNWTGAQAFYCFWYTPDGEFKAIELEKIPDAEIENLLECEVCGDIYQRPVLVVENELKEKIEQAEAALIAAETTYKEAKAREELLRAELLKIMEQQGVRSWETDKVKATYVAKADRITVDSKKLKQNYGAIYTECAKMTSTAAHVRIKIKGADDEEQ